MAVSRVRWAVEQRIAVIGSRSSNVLSSATWLIPFGAKRRSLSLPLHDSRSVFACLKKYHLIGFDFSISVH